MSKAEKTAYMIWGGAIASGLALFWALMKWLDYHGYFISPDAIYFNVLAKSFSDTPYLIWFKRAFSYSYEIIHHDFNFPPLWPFLHWLFEQFGMTTWHRGNWMTAFFIGLTPVAWMWSLQPHFSGAEFGPKVKKNALLVSLASGWIATAALLAMAYNQMWHELYLGIVSPVAVFFYLITYGCYIRQKYIWTGVVLGITYMIRFDAQVTMVIFVLAHFALHINWKAKKWKAYLPQKKRLIEAVSIAGAFVAVTSPWWIRSVLLGHTPWFNHMVPIFMKGEAGHFTWNPATDTADGILKLPKSTIVFFFEILWQRWKDLTFPYFGSYFSPILILLATPFLLFFYQRKRIGQRIVILLVGFSLILRVPLIATLHDAFNRRYFLLVDVVVLSLVALMIWDKKVVTRVVAVVILCTLVVANWGPLKQVTRTMRPGVGYLDAGSPYLASALKELNKNKDVVLTEQITGHAMAYYTERMPIIEMPWNNKMPGIMDAFIKRWNVKWVTDPGNVAPFVKNYELVPRRASNGFNIHEVIPKPAP